MPDSARTDDLHHGGGAPAPPRASHPVRSGTATPDTQLPGLLAALPPRLAGYAQLARWDRPIGIWLLVLPCWIGLTHSAIHQQAGLGVLLGWGLAFLFGAAAMRGAGCTWNDIADRELDAQVERTASRPLPSGKVTLRGALAFLVVQLLAGFAVFLLLPTDGKLWALAALGIAVAYPFAKRHTWWPQAVLGAGFAWGALVAAAAVGEVTLASVILFAGLALWVTAYDTIYALQDVQDDARAGIKSSARRLGRHAVAGAFALHCGAAALVAAAALAVGGGDVAALAALAFLAHGAGQALHVRRRKRAPKAALAAFRSNLWAGLFLVAGFSAAALAQPYSLPRDETATSIADAAASAFLPDHRSVVLDMARKAGAALDEAEAGRNRLRSRSRSGADGQDGDSR